MLWNCLKDENDNLSNCIKSQLNLTLIILEKHVLSASSQAALFWYAAVCIFLLHTSVLLSCAVHIYYSDGSAEVHFVLLLVLLGEEVVVCWLFHMKTGHKDSRRKMVWGGEGLNVKSNGKHKMQNASKNMHICNKQVSQEYVAPQREQICTEFILFMLEERNLMCIFYIHSVRLFTWSMLIPAVCFSFSTN